MNPAPVSGSPSRDLLLAAPRVRWLVTRSWLVISVAGVLLLATVALAWAGLVGPPVGNRNNLVVAVWIVWWSCLIAVLVPLGGRAWCAVCPIPLPGDGIQRSRAQGRVDRRRSATRTTGRRWPRPLTGLWLQTAGFLLLATFSTVLLTSPLATALAVGGMVLVAAATASIFRGRTFCRFLCPVGGFVGLYAKVAPLAVRARDAGVCASCREKGCLTGNLRGRGCPWLEYPSRLDRNNTCGLCLECLRACDHGNMSLFLRPPLSEHRLLGYDEAWKAFVMLFLALAYSAVFLGPWGILRDAADGLRGGQGDAFAAYAACLWLGALVVVPAGFAFAAWLGRRLAGGGPFRGFLLAGAAAAVPMGLFAWVAFSIPLVLVNASYAVAAASDPAGLGWDLLGTRDIPWTPVLTTWIPGLQAAAVLTGLALALRTGLSEMAAVAGRGRPAVRGFTPSAMLITAFAMALLGLYVG